MEKYTLSEKPNIHILSIENDETGNPKFSYEVNSAFIEMIKKDKKIDNINENVISEYITDLLDKCASNKNGYGYEKVNLTNKKIDK
jgi:hypothetical protein